MIRKLVVKVGKITSVREMKPSDDLESLHRAGHGVVAMDDAEWLMYLRHLVAVESFQIIAEGKARVNLLAYRDYGDFPDGITGRILMKKTVVEYERISHRIKRLEERIATEGMSVRQMNELNGAIRKRAKLEARIFDEAKG